MFTLTACIFAFAYDDFPYLVWALVGITLIFLLVATVVSTGSQRTFGLFCIAALAIGSAGGMFIETTRTSALTSLSSKAVYRNVVPSTLGTSHRDAGIIHFAEGSFVDASQSLGYVSEGTIHCVAPILGSTIDARPSFWAVGRNCCGTRGAFNCGLTDSSARSGIVESNNQKYQTAIRMAVATYGLQPAQYPIMLHWAHDPTSALNNLWTSAMKLLVIFSSIAFIVVAFVTCFLPRSK